MEMMTLKLKGRDAEGKERYRSYYLVTDGGRMAGRGRASVIPMSIGAPMPEDEHVEVDQGGEEHALMKLVSTLLALPGNEGLVAELTDMATPPQSMNVALSVPSPPAPPPAGEGSFVSRLRRLSR